MAFWISAFIFLIFSKIYFRGKGIGKENFPDPTDRAALEADRNFELRIRDRERKLIVKMQEAIKRIDDGIFGICEVCGGPISEKRLMARPVTTLCIDCKTKQEKMEKLKGE